MVINCCNHTKRHKKCIRKKDKKVFTLPRKYSRVKCMKTKKKGFTMRSSCAIYKGCKGYKGGARSLKKDIAYFSAGCFWKVEEKFSKLDGVVVTDVGYMGGNRKNPSYQSFKNRFCVLIGLCAAAGAGYFMKNYQK